MPAQIDHGDHGGPLAFVRSFDNDFVADFELTRCGLRFGGPARAEVRRGISPLLSIPAGALVAFRIPTHQVVAIRVLVDDISGECLVSALHCDQIAGFELEY